LEKRNDFNCVGAGRAFSAASLAACGFAKMAGASFGRRFIQANPSRHLRAGLRLVPGAGL